MGDEEVEVTVTVPDSEPEDTNDNGIPDSFEAGRAAEQAENAEEAAEEAVESAEEAQEVAGAAAGIAIDASIENQQLRDELVAQGQVLAAQQEQLNRIADLLEASAKVTAATVETQAAAAQPPDEAPRSNHFLTRKLWGS